MRCLLLVGLLTLVLPIQAATAEPPESASASGRVTTLSEALELTLTRNPGLRGLTEDIEAQGALVTQAGLIPNPELAVTAEQLGEEQDGVSPAQGEIRLNQRVELGGKRQARIDRASVEKEQKRIEAALTTIEVMAEVKKAWAQLGYLVTESELQAHQLSLSSKLISAVRGRVEAGGTLPAELTKAQTSYATDEIETKRIGREIVSARQMIASFWGGAPEDVSPVVTIETVDPMPDLSGEVSSNALSIRRLELAVEAADRAWELEKARAVPDVTLGAGYQRLAGIKENALLLSFSMPLPFSDRNQGGIESARRLLTSAKQKAANERLKINSKVRMIVSSLRSLAFEIRQSSDVIIPQAEKSFAGLQSAYSVGKASFIDVVDAQRMLLSARRRRLEAQRSYYEMKVDLESMTATTPPSLPR